MVLNIMIEPKYNPAPVGKCDKLQSSQKGVLCAADSNYPINRYFVVYSVGTEEKGLDLLITILSPQISRMSVYLA